MLGVLIGLLAALDGRAYATGDVYVWGGSPGITSVWSAAVTGPGTLGTWTSQTAYPTLQIAWAVSDPVKVQVKVYDFAGELVRELPPEPCVAGVIYRAIWDGRNFEDRPVASNIHVLRLVILGERKPLERRAAVQR